MVHVTSPAPLLGASRRPAAAAHWAPQTAALLEQTLLAWRRCSWRGLAWLPAAASVLGKRVGVLDVFRGHWGEGLVLLTLGEVHTPPLGPLLLPAREGR